MTFKNEDEGRDAHLLQGFPIDGTKIPSLQLSAFTKHDNVHAGPNPSDLPMVIISFYDRDRKELGYVSMGPFRGSADWYREEKVVRVPPQARFGLLRIGLFGATGAISFDAVKMAPD